MPAGGRPASRADRPSRLGAREPLGIAFLTFWPRDRRPSHPGKRPRGVRRAANWLGSARTPCLRRQVSAKLNSQNGRDSTVRGVRRLPRRPCCVGRQSMTASTISAPRSSISSRKNGHEVVASSPLVPRNDPTLMFTNAGMVQFKNVFTGQEKRALPRAATAQKCVRAGGKHNDLDNVGYTARHHTFFEMLGNFSFGDYFKERAIELAWELLTKDFGLPKDRLLVTVYPDDDEAAELWSKIAGLPETDHPHRRRRQFLVDGRHRPVRTVLRDLLRPWRQIPGGPPGSPDADGDRFVEIWNLVFMQYEQLRRRRARRRCRIPRSTPAWGSSASPRCCRAPTTITTIDLFRALIAASVDLTGVPADGRACAEPSHHRRSSARLVLPHRRRRAAVERGQGLRAPPHHAPRHAARPYSRRQGAADVSAGAGAGRADGPRLSRARARPKR